MKAWGIFAGVTAFTIILVYWFFNHSGYVPFAHNPMQYMPNMHRTQALKPQRAYSFNEQGTSAFVPPNGSLAREIGYQSTPQPDPYPYSAELRGEDVPRAANPYPKNRETVLRGQVIYNQYCVVCHGPQGLGNGSIIGPYARPPALITEKLINWADSQLYHVVMVGQNQMYPYAHAIREEDRWKLIHYIRVLQLAYNPSEEDLEAFEDYIGADAEDVE